MNVFTSLAEVESFCAGIFAFMLVVFSLLLCVVIDHIKINKDLKKIEKRVTILFKCIQRFVPDGQYVSVDQFLDMYPDLFEDNS